MRVFRACVPRARFPSQNGSNTCRNFSKRHRRARFRRIVTLAGRARVLELQELRATAWGKPPLASGPLTPARAYTRSHSGPRRARKPAHRFSAPGPHRGELLGACVGPARFALTARSCCPARSGRVHQVPAAAAGSSARLTGTLSSWVVRGAACRGGVCGGGSLSGSWLPRA